MFLIIMLVADDIYIFILIVIIIIIHYLFVSIKYEVISIHFIFTFFFLNLCSLFCFQKKAESNDLTQTLNLDRFNN